MPHSFCTTDPISGKDLYDVTSLPQVVEGDANNDLTIYFESKATRQVYLDIPLEHPATEHALDLDNPIDECIW